ncbi:MAG: DegT/DnrJ/EryC1/StrS family aminotransferase [Actinobacteria bacterium]|nr:DegT/DnrJ/EryC1/StrS family aminotransferase [Actinomycetota bacterium]
MYRIGKEEIEEIKKVIESKTLFRVGDPKRGHQQEVDRFEKEWSEKIGIRYTLCMAGGGTAALICALVGLEIGPGDEVIVPGYTFMATALSVLAVGAIPVIAEIDESLTIDPIDVEKKITSNTKAVIPVHMLGLPSDMEKINHIAQKYNLKVLEDSCQADGGSYKDKRLGSWGDVGAFSFNDFKILTCGEGGAIVTNDTKIYERALVYHDGGANFRPYAKELSIPVFAGLQFRASEIMGAILRIQIQRLEGILSDLRRIKHTFLNELSGKPGVKFAKSNDIDGDCGVAVAFQFDDEKQARRFSTSEGVNAWLPIDSGKHLYFNWDPILEKRIGPNPALNPFYLPQNKNLRTDYTKDMCPKITDITGRTVIVSLSPDWTDQQVKDKISDCKKALGI